MKKFLLFSLLLFYATLPSVAQDVAPKNILYSPDLTVTEIDTASVSRGAVRVFATVYQYAKNDSVTKKELLRRFSQHHKYKILDIKKLEYHIGCDCETTELMQVGIYHKFETAEEGPMSMMTIVDSFSWPKTSFSTEEYGYNDIEKQLINSLCSRYTYKIDSISHNLLIEEIPPFLQENPRAQLQSVARMPLKCELPYKPFEKFNNDTTAFLRYNFKDRAICYRGKTVKDVLKDLQLEPKKFLINSSIRVNKYAGINIYVDDVTSYDVVHNPGRKTQSIYIYWPDLMDSREVTILIRTYKDYGDTWIPQYYDFFKDIIVGEVQYYK